MTSPGTHIRELNWHIVCDAGDVTMDDPKAVTVGENEIGLFRTANGLYAIDNLCTHQFASLTKGGIEGDVVECPLHEARFCLRSGACLKGPARRPVATFPVLERSGKILIGLSDG
jgi:nitrite reductase/ring-hydroxylating ferredoxin subunit